jgi:hypothetical protein
MLELQQLFNDMAMLVERCGAILAVVCLKADLYHPRPQARRADPDYRGDG